MGKCSDLGVPAPCGRNVAPMRVYHRRGHLIGESQERVASAKSLPGDVGDEVGHLVDWTSIGWKSHFHRRLRSRIATRPFQLTGADQRNTPKSELLPEWAQMRPAIHLWSQPLTAGIGTTRAPTPAACHWTSRLRALSSVQLELPKHRRSLARRRSSGSACRVRPC